MASPIVFALIFLALWALFFFALISLSIRNMRRELRSFDVPEAPAYVPVADDAHRRLVEDFEAVGHRVIHDAEIPIPPGARLHRVTLLLGAEGDSCAEVVSRSRKPPRFGLTSFIDGAAVYTQSVQGVITIPNARKQVFRSADAATLHREHRAVLDELARREIAVDPLTESSLVDTWVRSLRRVGEEHPSGPLVALRAAAIAAGRVEDGRRLLDVPGALDGLRTTS